MEAIIGIIELAGAVVLLFAAGWVFARISGYGEHYDKMLYDEDADAEIKIKKSNTENDDDIIHHVSI
jgi:hypothetical protein